MTTNESINKIKEELDNLEQAIAQYKIDKTTKENNDTLKKNKFVFYGWFSNNDNTEAKFTTEVNLEALTDINIEEVASLLNAFGNYERFKIITLLLEKSRSASEIMTELNFKTTGKVYHHLNALLGAGIIIKDEDQYRIKAKRIQGILAMLVACHCYLAKSRGDIIDMEALKKE